MPKLLSQGTNRHELIDSSAIPEIVALNRQTGITASVDIQYSSIAPSTKSSGSALTFGDQWINLSTGVRAFWNGTYWLSPQQVITTGRYGSYTTSQSGGSAILRGEPVFPQANIFFASGKICIPNMSSSGADYWTGQLGYHLGLAAAVTLLGSAINLTLAQNTTNFVINTALIGSVHDRLLGIELTKVGSPVALLVSAEYYYHFIL
jgi:hypothetical protein